MIRAAATAIATALVLSLASIATAGTTTLAFTHPDDSNIVEYRALTGTKSGQYTQDQTLGVPSKFGNVFSATLQIPDNVQVYIAVVAVDSNGVRSAPSNERVRSSSSESLLGPPGKPMIIFE